MLKANTPDDDSTRKSALRVTLDSSDAKYVVSRVGRYMQDPEKQVTLGETNLEHIYPQNPDTDAWGGQKNQELLEPLTWNIGNLTIFGTRANRKASNEEFVKKRPRYAQSKVAMTNEIANSYQDWNRETIAHRAEQMAKLVVQIWNFDNPSRV